MKRLRSAAALAVAIVGTWAVTTATAQTNVPDGYGAAWQRIPPQHQALVGTIVVEGRTVGMAERRGHAIHLPPADSGAIGELAHEVGHIVFWSDPTLSLDWRRQFWPDGAILGQPATNYGRTNADEDFAETYQAMIEDGAVEDAGRLTFMQTRVFAVSATTEPLATVDVSRVAPAAPCGDRLPSGSIVSGCAAVPAGSVR